MTLRIIGKADAFGYDVIDVETGVSVLPSLAALRLHLVLYNNGAHLESDHHIEFDYIVPSAVRAFLGCPEIGQRRELQEIVYVDGGRVVFPRDFSSGADVERVCEALPQKAAPLPKKV